MMDLEHGLTSYIAPCTAISTFPSLIQLLDTMITAKPFYSSQTTNPQIRVTVLDYHEKVFVAIIFLHKKTADKDLFKDIFHGSHLVYFSRQNIFRSFRISVIDRKCSAFIFPVQVKYGRDRNRETKNENRRSNFVFQYLTKAKDKKRK